MFGALRIGLTATFLSAWYGPPGRHSLSYTATSSFAVADRALRRSGRDALRNLRQPVRSEPPGGLPKLAHVMPGAGGGRAKPLVLCMRVGGSYCRLDAFPREGSTTHVRRFDPTCSLEAPSAICRCRVCLGRGGERPVVRPDPEDKGAAHRRRTRYLLGPRRGPDAGSTKSRWPEALGRQVGLFPHHRYHERSLGVRAQARGGLIRRLLGEGRYRNQEAATRVGRPYRRHRLPKRRIATPMSVS